jgi:hypothetical protein
MSIRGTATTIVYLAWDTVNNIGKTGDVLNHTLRGICDGTEFTPAGTPAEVDATNLKGLYKIALTAAENNGNILTLGGISSTPNIIITPVNWMNEAFRSVG